MREIVIANTTGQEIRVRKNRLVAEFHPREKGTYIALKCDQSQNIPCRMEQEKQSQNIPCRMEQEKQSQDTYLALNCDEKQGAQEEYFRGEPQILKEGVAGGGGNLNAAARANCGKDPVLTVCENVGEKESGDRSCCSAKGDDHNATTNSIDGLFPTEQNKPGGGVSNTPRKAVYDAEGSSRICESIIYRDAQASAGSRCGRDSTRKCAGSEEMRQQQASGPDGEEMRQQQASGPEGRNLTQSQPSGRVNWREFEEEPLKSINLTELKQRSEREVEDKI